MKSIREQISNQFERAGHLIYQNSKKTLLILLIIIGSMVVHLPEVKIDTSTESFFHKDDPALVRYNAFREEFGRDSLIIAAIKPPEIFSKSFLTKLKSFHEDLENNVSYLNEVTSLINVTSIRGEEGELIVEDLLEDWPDDEQAINKIKKRTLANQLYINNLISENGKLTVVVLKSEAFSPQGVENDESLSDDLIEDEIDETKTGKIKTDRQILTAEENADFVKSTLAVIKKHQADDFKISVAGSPLLVYHLQDKMINEVPLFTGSALIIFAFLLFILFRRISGVILPLLVVFLSMVSTIGLMAFKGDPLTTITQILPGFIISIGIGASVHLLVIFFQQLRQTQDKEASIAFAMGHSGLPMLLTALTTAAGLLSFSNAEIAPIGSLGIFSAIGVMLSFLYTLTIIPALIALFPMGRKSNTQEISQLTFQQKILINIGYFATDRPWTVVIFSLLITALGILGVSKLIFSHNPLVWLPTNDTFRVATEYIDKEMKGSMSIEVIVDTQEPDKLYDPDIMNRLEVINHAAKELKHRQLHIGKSISIADTVKQINQALNENNPDKYVIPQNRELIAQELLLFSNSGSEDLEKQVDNQFSKARITLKLPWEDSNTYVGLLEKLEALLQKTFENKAIITVTGMTMLLTKTMFSVIETMISSYSIAAVVITVMMILLIGNIKIGLISMIPNFLPILLGLGLMGFNGMHLDMTNILVGSIAIGLAVDDTVHFLHNFNRYNTTFKDPRKAVAMTMQTTGQAMIFTTIILFFGFLVFTLSSLTNLVSFGLISAFTIVMALLADLLLVPALLILITRLGIKID